MADMRNHFDAARQRPPEQDLEELRQNYFIQATMQGSDDPSIGGLRVNVSGRKNEFAAGNGKAKKSTLADELMFLDMLEQKYGEYFAENWAAELLDEETYSELMKIEDQAERRRAIAEAIQRGIDDGTIDPAEVQSNPDLARWLEYEQEMSRNLTASLEAGNQPQAQHELEQSDQLESGFSNLFDNKL